ncbi:hypothetical protein MTO96_044323 [Rhipicephalus appendiculatus]
MPANDTMIPAWFKNADASLSALGIPVEMQGALILPFLSDAIRTSVIGQSVSGTLSYGELKEKVLKELKMTPAEYRRRFLDIKKEAGESWNHLAARLEMIFNYYLSSREVHSFEQLQALLIADRLKQLMPPDIRSFVIQGEIKGWLQAKELAELAENFEESTSHRVTSSPDAMAKQMRHIHGASNLTPDRMLCYACGEPGHFRRDCGAQRGIVVGNKEISCVAMKNYTRQRTYHVKHSHRSTGNSTDLGNTGVRIFVADRLCRARIDSGADITVIGASEVPAEILRQSCGHVKLTGAFGQAITAEVMYVPLGLPCPVGSANQRVPVLCAVTPELAVSADLLLTPDDYESLCLALKESGCHPKGGECGIVKGSSKEEGTFVTGNVEPVAQASTGEAARGAAGEETNKRVKGVASCKVNAGLRDQEGVDQSSEITEHEEVEPQSDDHGEMVGMAHVRAAGDSLQVRGSRCWDLAGKS